MSQAAAQAAAATPAAEAKQDQAPRAQLVERQHLAIRFLVEPETFTIEDKGDRHHFNLEFFVTAFKGDKQIASHSQSVEGNTKPETYNKIMRDGLLFTTTVNVPPGNCRLRLLVRDDLTGNMGAVDVPVTEKTETVQQ